MQSMNPGTESPREIDSADAEAEEAMLAHAMYVSSNTRTTISENFE